MMLLIASFVLGVGGTDFVVLITVAVLVIAVEMLNTAVEIITDILFKEYDQRAKIIKDTAAGAVLITALGSALIGYIILFEPVKKYFHTGLSVAKHTGADVAVVSLLAVLILVVITKAFFGKGEPLRGGMPSGHAAVAFSIWISVTMTSGSFLPSLLVFIMAVLIAQSRVSIGIHRPIEVILGALLGIAVTFLLFKIFA